MNNVARRARDVVDYLSTECGLPPGRSGVGAALLAAPHALLTRPTRHDRWDRRFVQLAAHAARAGHVDVPHDAATADGTGLLPPSAAGLGAWCARQRAAWQAGTLPPERAAALAFAGFDFGDVAQVTDAWEASFDELVDAMLGAPAAASGAAPTPVPGEPRATTLAAMGRPSLGLWVALQRTFKARGLLSPAVAKRLDAVGFGWWPPVGSGGVGASPATASSRLARQPDTAWEASLGCILLAAERARVRPAPDRLGVGVGVATPAATAATDLWRRLDGATLARPQAAWLTRQTALWLARALPPERSAMLRAAGWSPDDPLAAPRGWRARARRPRPAPPPPPKPRAAPTWPPPPCAGGRARWPPWRRRGGRHRLKWRGWWLLHPPSPGSRARTRPPATLPPLPRWGWCRGPTRRGGCRR